MGRVEKGNLKALLRRALARKEKKEWKKSLNDLALVLAAEPKNKRALELKGAVDSALEEEKRQREQEGMAGGRRMIIEEVDSEEEEEEAAAEAAAAEEGGGAVAGDV